MVIVSGIVCIYYNVIMAWALYFLYATFTTMSTGRLPWETCDNWWNTPHCASRISRNLTRNASSLINGSAVTAAYDAVDAVDNVTQSGMNLTAVKRMTPSEEFWQ